MDERLLKEAYDLLSQAKSLQQKAYNMLAGDTKTRTLDKLAVKALTSYEVKTGSLLLNQYRVQRTLGSCIYMVTDIETDQTLVVKSAKDDDTGVVNGYMISKKLKDIKGIQKPVDLVHSNGWVFAIYEYVPGEPLTIATPANIADTIKELCRIVSEVHKKGFIHRDITLNNLVIDMHGNLHLIDFDIAVEMGEDQKAVVTEALGTMNYAPPECYKQGNQIDQSADIFSIGMVYSKLLGRKNPVIAKATNQNPELRYKSAEEMSRHLK